MNKKCHLLLWHLFCFFLHPSSWSLQAVSESTRLKGWSEDVKPRIMTFCCSTLLTQKDSDWRQLGETNPRRSCSTRLHLPPHHLGQGVQHWASHSENQPNLYFKVSWEENFARLAWLSCPLSEKYWKRSPARGLFWMLQHPIALSCSLTRHVTSFLG